jgi:hypothetical protein
MKEYAIRGHDAEILGMTVIRGDYAIEEVRRG